LAEQSVSLDYCIKVWDTTILSTKMTYMDWMIREAIKMELHLNNINREGVLHVNWSQKPIIHINTGRRKHQVQLCQSPFGH
jgi:hypothetical protein